MCVCSLPGTHVLVHTQTHTHTYDHVSLRGRLVADMGATNGRASPWCPRVTRRKRTALPGPSGCEKEARGRAREPETGEKEGGGPLGGGKGARGYPMEEGSGRWGPGGAGEEEKEGREVKEALSR